MTIATDTKGGFPVEEKRIFLSLALLGDPRIFTDQIRILQVFDPYSIRDFHYSIRYVGSNTDYGVI